MGKWVPAVTAPPWTIRVRLTLLYTGPFVACGALVIAITYGLVASLPASTDSFARLGTAIRNRAVCPFEDDQLLAQCKEAFREAANAAARDQRETTWRHLGAVLADHARRGHAAGRAGRVDRRRPGPATGPADHRGCPDRVGAQPGRPGLPGGPRDELRELADTFDAMLARLQAAFEGQRRFIANAGHELRTLLTVMRATLDVVLAKPAPTPGELRRMGQDVRAATDHAQRLINALLSTGPQRPRAHHPRTGRPGNGSPRTSWTPPTGATGGCTPRWSPL